MFLDDTAHKRLRFRVNGPISEHGSSPFTVNLQGSLVSRHQLGSFLAISIALSAQLVACGADNDILRPTPQAPAAPQNDMDPQTNTDPTANDDDLSNADQLTSGDTGAACEVSACPTPSMGVACCTTDDDITAVRAVVAGHCGVDMASIGFPGCVQRDQPGVLDEACPPVAFPPDAPPMPGCCTASGHCGAMETFMGFGCTSNPVPASWVACGG